MTSITDIYCLYKTHPNICTDTRNIIKNCIFFCLKGDNFNGNTFATEALEKGAAYAIVDEKDYILNNQCIYVSDVLETLQSLALHHRQQLTIPVIGITGSNGKTTTKELVKVVLSKKYNVFATHGNLNNHIGVPLSLLSINKEVEIAVVEMGANHPHEIDFLCKIALPTMGLITNIGKAHLEGFHTINAIIETKTALYKSVKQANGKVFVNMDDPLLLHEASDIPAITYGMHAEANYKGKILADEWTCKVLLPESNTIITTQLIGNYNFHNIMAAIAIGNYFNVPISDMQDSLSSYQPTNSRSQIIKKGSNTIILDTYNANPSSMEMALENFATIKNKNKIIILGDMKELGTASLTEHQHIVDLIRKEDFSDVYLIGPEFALTKTSSYKTFTSFEDASRFVKERKIQDSILLIKGSRSMKMERFLDLI